MRCEWCRKECDELTQDIHLPGIKLNHNGATRTRMVCDACLTPPEAVRAELAARANKQTGPDAPQLRADMSKEEVFAWCAWCDPNGTYDAASMAREGYDNDLENAWECVRTLVENA